MQKVTLAASRNAAFAVLDDGAVLLNVETGRYFGLDDVATHIWKQLLDGASESELVDGLVAEYDVEPQRAQADLTSFLPAPAPPRLAADGRHVRPSLDTESARRLPAAAALAARAWVALARVDLQLRRRGFQATLATVSSAAPAAGASELQADHTRNR